MPNTLMIRVRPQKRKRHCKYKHCNVLFLPTKVNQVFHHENCRLAYWREGQMAVSSKLFNEFLQHRDEFAAWLKAKRPVKKSSAAKNTRRVSISNRKR